MLAQMDNNNLLLSFSETILDPEKEYKDIEVDIEGIDSVFYTWDINTKL